MRLISTLAEIEKLVNSFASLDSFEVLIDTIKVQIELVAESDTTGLYLYSEEESKLKLFYAKGFSKVEQANAELTAMERHPGHVFRTGEILWVNDQDTENNPFSIDSVRKTHTRSRLYVPVKSNNKIIGAFGIQSETPNAFTEKHLAVLKVFASLAGDAYSSIKRNNLIKQQNEENKKLSYLAKNTPNLVIYADKDGKITWVNEYFENSTGYKLHEIIGKTPGSFLTGPETEPEKTSQLRNAIQTKTPVELTITNYKKNGELYYLEVQLNPVFDDNAELLYFIAVQQDVTDLEIKNKKLAENQKQLQANLKSIAESQKKYSNLLQTTNDLITSLDDKGTILYANNSWLKKMDYSLKEVLGTIIFSYIHPDSQQHCMSFFGELSSGQHNSLDVTYSLISKVGKKIDIEGNVICKHENNTLLEINSFFKDVTEINRIRQLEEFKQQEIILHNKNLTEINSINFLSYVNFNSVLQDITSRASVCLDSKRISIWSYTGHSIICEDFFDCDANEHSSGNEIFEKDFPKYFNGIKTQLIINASDAHQNEFTKELSASYLTPLNINSMLDIPIKINNILWGVICIEHVGEKIKWSNEDVAFSKAIADIIANTNVSFTFQETANKLEQVMGALNESVWGVILPDFKLNYVSESAVALYEMPLENWYANPNLWSDVIHPDDKERILKESEALFTVGYTNLEYRIITGSNKVKWIFSNTKVLKNEEGVPYLMTGIAGDITARKLAEQELLNYKTALDESAIVSITDVNGIITYANDKFCEISKYSHQELIGATHNIVNSNYHSKEFFNDLWQTISSGAIWKGEIKNKAKDGSEYYVETTIVPFMENGKPFQYIAIRYESTKLKLKEEAILKQKQFYENILNNIPVDIAVFDEQHKYLFLNKEAIKSDEIRDFLIGKDDFDYAKFKGISTDSADQRREKFNQAITSKNQTHWLDSQKNNAGVTKYKERRYHPYDKFVIGYGVDVTRFKDQELRLSNSLEEKETLLGEVNHRVKNNLALIAGLIELQERNNTDIKVISNLSEIKNRISTMALIYEKLYASSNFKQINLKDYIQDLVKNLLKKRNANETIIPHFNMEEIIVDFKFAMPIGFIVNELIANSLKYAIKNNNDLNIYTELKNLNQKNCLQISDDGPGLSEDIDLLKSKTLGFKLVNIFVRQIKGSIEFKRNPGLTVLIKF